MIEKRIRYYNMPPFELALGLNIDPFARNRALSIGIWKLCFRIINKIKYVHRQKFCRVHLLRDGDFINGSWFTHVVATSKKTKQ